MSVLRKPDARTHAAQHRASDPGHSAWVSAHAGSGKTHVLAARVVRLLLEGVPPARILCLTFTKAGAANMSARVFKMLSDWAVADDAALREKLDALGATGVENLAIARTLFARAVETPGGLKIQTIHAFCERVLHLFPFEANVAADFRAIEEVEQSELMAEARSAALAEMAGRDDASRAALALVAEGTWDGGFITLVNEMTAHRRTLGDTTPAERAVALRQALGLDAEDTEEALGTRILDDGIKMPEWRSIAERLSSGSNKDRELGERLHDASHLPRAAAVEAYLAAYRTDKDWRKQPLITSKMAKADPDLAARIAAEMVRLPPLREKWLATRIIVRTRALEEVCGAVIAHYERAKQMRAFLDFDDLITRTNALLNDAQVSAWVLFKLDGGIDHILVDEAQDTSKAQWNILEALAREFTGGEGRPRARRTFFAVGDEKQSIFSFQGAAPAMFDEMRRMFERREREAERALVPVRLSLSFRSSPDVLDAVDRVFEDAVRRQGLWSDPAAPTHQALKADLPGLVELWPPLAATERPPPDGWLLPVDMSGEHEPPAKLARKIATKIAHLTDRARCEAVEGATPGSKRQITPGDIMILVRRRDAFFEAVIRSLKDLGVAVAGADRLDVVGHIAVMDCAAVGRVALLPDDDLSLATVLKSPFIGLTDDDLILLAPKRRGSLWAALNASDMLWHREATARIARWRIDAARMSPFSFYAQLLGAEHGRRALLERLGPEANDALDEFLSLALAHEAVHAPSLVTFLASLDQLTLDVKRDLEAAHDAVRVMTVHAAKGLEAKIVFLPDTCATPSGRFDPAVYAIDTPAGRTLAWSAKRGDDPAPIIAARDAIRRAQEEEYRRLLYVAMTRAEERLYISGYYNKIEPKADTWHGMISAALRPHCEVVMDNLEDFGEVSRRGSPSTLDGPVETAQATVAGDLPDWLTRPAREEGAARSALAPSSALAHANRRDVDDTAATRARQRGIAVHKLLQRLPDVEPRARAKRAKVLLAAWPDLAADHDAIIRDVLAVLKHPDLAPLFARSSLAEVAVVASLPQENGAPVRIAGQIDRLVETPDALIVIDYKTGADHKTGSAEGERPAAAHVGQLALYAAALRQVRPGKPIRAVLIYIEGLKTVWLDDTTLAGALASALASARAMEA